MARRNNKEKIWLAEDIASFLHWELEGPIDAAIGHFETIKEDAETNGFKGVRIDYNREYGYGDDYEIRYVVSGKRLETDEEFEKRKQKAKNQQIAQKDRRKREKIEREIEERALYEELKERYEK